MKKLLVALAGAAVLVGCAGSKKNVQFVPLQISWKTVDEVDTGAQNVSACMVHATNAVMSHDLIQRYAGTNSSVSFVATISSRTTDGGLNYEIEGVCPVDASLSPETCSWKAVCNENGEFVSLEMGHK